MFDFEKNQTVDDLSVVPEDFRGLYVEETTEDGETTYNLNPGTLGIISNYSGLLKANQRLEQQKKAANDESATRRHELNAYDEMMNELGIEVGEGHSNIDVIKATIKELTEKTDEGKTLRINLDRAKADYDKKLKDEVGKKQAEVDDMQKSLHKYLIEREATAAIASQKGSVQLLLPLVSSRAEVVKNPESGEYMVAVPDGMGSHRIDGRGGLMTIKDLVEEYKTNPDFARAFESNSPSGGGTPPGGANASPGRPTGPVQPSIGGNNNNTGTRSGKDLISAGLEKGLLNNRR